MLVVLLEAPFVQLYALEAASSSSTLPILCALHAYSIFPSTLAFSSLALGSTSSSAFLGHHGGHLATALGSAAIDRHQVQ